MIALIAKKRLLVFTGLILVAFRLSASVSFLGDSDRSYRDSLRSHIFEKGYAEVNCYLSYPIGDSVVDPDFGTNGSELAVLHRFLRYALEDTLVCVQQVEITGYSSIDGSTKVNERLAHSRADRFLRYLDTDYRITEKYPVEVSSVGADWVKFRELIAASHYFWKEDALRIIDGPGSYEWKKMQISYLGGGDGHKRMYELYPLLRRVEVKITYDVQCMKGKLHRSGIPWFGDFSIRVLKLKSLNTPPLKRRSTLYPVWSFSTNLLPLSGLVTVDNNFRYRSPLPNLSVEFFFARRWSVKASGMYAHWHFSSNRHFWGISGYSVEPRVWLNGNRHFKGFYLGVFGQAGEFDIRYKGNHTGRYIQTGLSAGYYLSLSRHWGLGVGVRGGYEHADAKAYSVESSHYYYDATVPVSRWGVCGVEISLGYRFGR